MLFIQYKFAVPVRDNLFSGENLSLIREDQFELLMDRLEKESYFQVSFDTDFLPVDAKYHI
jgi:hypothetical protein